MKFAVFFLFSFSMLIGVVSLQGLPTDTDLLLRLIDRVDAMESNFIQKIETMETRFTQKFQALESKVSSETQILRKDIFSIYYNLQNFERRLNHSYPGMREGKGDVPHKSSSQQVVSLQRSSVKKELNVLKRGVKAEKVLNKNARQEIKSLASDILGNREAVSRIERSIQEVHSNNTMLMESMQEIKDISEQILEECNSNRFVQFEKRLTNKVESTRNAIIEVEISFLSNYQNLVTSLENVTSRSTESVGFIEGVHTNSQEVLRLLYSSIEDWHRWKEKVSAVLANVSNFVTKPKIPPPFRASCRDLFNDGYTNSGMYRMKQYGLSEFEGYCDMKTDGGGWLVIQRRVDGTVDFFRTWEEYKVGFGNKNGEFWLGNELIYKLTSNVQHELRIDLEDFDNDKRYAKYNSFSIGPDSSNYMLTIGSYSGNAGGDSLRYHNGIQFSTKDKESYAHRCANRKQGAWWFRNCAYSDLNGPYRRGPFTGETEKGMFWRHFRGLYYSLKESKMMIRPVA